MEEETRGSEEAPLAQHHATIEQGSREEKSSAGVVSPIEPSSSVAPTLSLAAGADPKARCSPSPDKLLTCTCMNVWRQSAHQTGFSCALL